MPIPEVIEMLKRIEEIHSKKNQDYAKADNPFSNFERSAQLMSWFTNETDKSFVNLIGTKLARLAELLNGKEPKNESISDSFLDLATYCVLWGSWYERQYSKKEYNQVQIKSESKLDKMTREQWEVMHGVKLD